MQAYNKGYEDLDEYEEDFDDQYEDLGGEGYGGEDEEMEAEEEEEQEEEEDPRKQQEVKDYLGLRQKFKEMIRKKLTKENGSIVANSPDKKKKLPLEKFGSFFGPSVPVIADRVIQESKSLLENRHLAPKDPIPHIDSKKVTPSSTSGQKNGVSHKPLHSQIKSKAEIIKDTRDYSFLLSDDTEIPRPAKDPSRQNNSVQKSDARSAQVPAKSRDSNLHSSRQASNGHEGKRTLSGNSQIRPSHTQSSQKPVKSNPTSLDLKRQPDSKKLVQPNKQLGNSNGSGPGRPSAPVGMPSKKPSSSAEKRAPSAAIEKKVPAPSVEKKAAAACVEKKRPVVGNSNRMHGGQTPLSAKLHASGVKQPLEHSDKIRPKETMSSSRPQLVKQQKQISSRVDLDRDRYQKKPKPGRPFHDEDDEAMEELSKLLGNYHKKHSRFDDDDDLSDMEVGFDTIMKEEKRSARIARKEDEEELRKIEEEERMERLRKKRKMMSQR